MRLKRPVVIQTTLIVAASAALVFTGGVASAMGHHSAPQSSPVGCASAPVGGHSAPVGKHSGPIGHHSGPIGKHSGPIGKHSGPVQCASSPKPKGHHEDKGHHGKGHQDEDYDRKPVHNTTTTVKKTPPTTAKPVKVKA